MLKMARVILAAASRGYIPRDNLRKEIERTLQATTSVSDWQIAANAVVELDSQELAHELARAKAAEFHNA